MLQFVGRNRPDLTEAQVITGLKRWLIYGIPMADDAQEEHKRFTPLECALLADDPAEDLDAQVLLLAPR